jgi:protein TonB
MKVALSFALVPAILAATLSAQAPAASGSQQPEIQISRDVAEKLLIHKADLVCHQTGMAARFTGTVVVGFSIDKNGNVIYPKVISGPPMLRKAVLDAVRKYKYKPYLFQGKPAEVETSVFVLVDSAHDCPSN